MNTNVPEPRPEETRAACPCCEAACHSVTQDGRAVTKFFRGHTALLLRCSSCGHVMFGPQPDDAILGLFYREAYRRHCTADEDYDPEYGYRKSHLDAVASAAREYLGRDHGYRLHDVGCGFGGLIHLLAGRGVSTSGNDFGDDALRAARERGNTGVFQGTLREYLRTAAEPVDMVTLFHCLEHFRAPQDELALIRSCLSKEGIVLVRVPNAMYYCAERASFHEYDWVQFPMHLHLFTPRSLRALAGRAGLRLLRVECTSWETDRDLLFRCLGLDESKLAEPGVLVEALRSNLLLRELQVILCRDDASHVATTGDSRFGLPLEPRIDAALPNGLVDAFSDRQGHAGLSYAFSRDLPRIDGLMVPALLDGFHVWQSPRSNSLIGRRFVSPDTDTPVIVWEPPRDGLVRLRVHVRILNDRSEGMRVAVFRGDLLVAEDDDIRPAGPVEFTVFVRVAPEIPLLIAFPSRGSPDYCFTEIGLACDYVDAIL